MQDERHVCPQVGAGQHPLPLESGLCACVCTPSCLASCNVNGTPVTGGGGQCPDLAGVGLYSPLRNERPTFHHPPPSKTGQTRREKQDLGQGLVTKGSVQSLPWWWAGLWQPPQRGQDYSQQLE